MEKGLLQLGYIRVVTSGTSTQRKIYRSHDEDIYSYLKEPRPNDNPYIRFEENFHEIAGEGLVEAFGLEGLQREMVSFNGNPSVQMQSIVGSLDQLSGKVYNFENNEDLSTALILLAWVGAGDHSLEALRNYGYAFSIDESTLHLYLIDFEHFFNGCRIEDQSNPQLTLENIKNLYPYSKPLSKLSIKKGLATVASLSTQKILYIAFQKTLHMSCAEDLDIGKLRALIDQKIMFLERRKDAVMAHFTELSENEAKILI